MEMVTINGVRYRRETAERLGLLRPGGPARTAKAPPLSDKKRRVEEAANKEEASEAKEE